MTREPGLDDQTIDWLFEGPDRAPDWVLVAVDAHARSHPRRRFDMWRPGRSLMSHLHLVRLEEDAGERRVSRAWAGFAVVALTAVLVVGAFGVGARWGRGEPPAGGIGLPSAAPASAVTTTGPVALAATCQVATGHVDTQAGGMTRSRGGQMRCSTTSPDPRLAGEMSTYWSIDRRADGTGDAWGEVTLRTGGGRWWGPFSGSVDPDGTQHLTGALFGANAHAALRLVFTQVGTPEAFVLQGRVERADAPSAAGEVVVRRLTALGGGDPGRESMDPAGVNHVQGRSTPFTVDASDPRLAGELTLVYAVEEDPADSSARLRGTESLVHAGGAWVGTWEGTWDAGWTTHRWTGTVKGSGAYAGLEYRFTTIGEYPRFIQVGEIVDGN
jgi:hypothetical protein